MCKNFVLALAVCMALAWHPSGLRAQEGLDIGLEEIFGIADRESRQVQVALTGAQAEKEAVRSAKSKRLPDVNLSLSGSYIGTASVLSRGFSSSGFTTVPYAIGVGRVENGAQQTPHWGNDFVAQVSQVIYAGGGISAGIRLAELGEKMSLLDVEKNRQEVRFLLTGHYLELSKLTNLLEVVRSNIGLTEMVLKSMRARYEQGTVIKSDITRFELLLQELRLSETRLSDAACIVNNQLVTTLHLPKGTVVRPRELSVGWDNFQQDYWQDVAGEQSIGLQQARLARDMSQEKVKAVRSEKMPQVALVVEDRLAGPYVNDLIPVDANVNAWFVGVGIKYNLGSLWRKNHDVRQARINARRSGEEVLLASEGVSKAVQAGFVTLQTSFAEVETQRKKVQMASEHYDVTNNRYENGLALLTDMIDASNMKLSADMDLVNARINLTYNYYKLKYISGSL